MFARVTVVRSIVWRGVSLIQRMGVMTWPMKPDRNTTLWWTSLRVVSVLNILAFVGVVATMDWSLAYRGWHLLLAGVYAGVCAFRSFFPRVDLERTVMVDHWLSSIVLGRTAATIAEMCFTAQLALVLLEASTVVPWLYPIGVAILPLIAVAQVACWMGALTGNHLWHAVEELLWTAMVLLMGVAGAGLWMHFGFGVRVFVGVGWLGCLSAVVVMSGLDVPMYIRRWRTETQAGTKFLSVGEGFVDALHRREPTGSWEVWRHEVAWMTPYFSASVWLSLFLARFSVAM